MSYASGLRQIPYNKPLKTKPIPSAQPPNGRIQIAALKTFIPTRNAIPPETGGIEPSSVVLKTTALPLSYASTEGDDYGNYCIINIARHKNPNKMTIRSFHVKSESWSGRKRGPTPRAQIASVPSDIVWLQIRNAALAS